MKFLQWFTIVGVMLLPIPAQANDALSVLLGNSIEAFILGTIWVLIVESVYCLYRFKPLLSKIIFVKTD